MRRRASAVSAAHPTAADITPYRPLPAGSCINPRGTAVGQLQHAACDLEVTLTSVLCAGSMRAEFLAGGRLKIVLGWVRSHSFLWPPRPGMVQAHALSSPLRC